MKVGFCGNAGLLVLLGVLVLACSFDYGQGQSDGETKPDLVMEDVEYVRFQGGAPLLRFRAENAERYEEKQIMNLKNFSFEQFEDAQGAVDARGGAAEAVVELDSLNISMSGGVRVAVDSEDILISTGGLVWQDKEQSLSVDEAGQVDITRSDGTLFTGYGFSADVRSRTFAFDGGVSGTYIEKDNGEKDAGDNAEGETVTEAAGEGATVKDAVRGPDTAAGPGEVRPPSLFMFPVF